MAMNEWLMVWLWMNDRMNEWSHWMCEWLPLHERPSVQVQKCFTSTAFLALAVGLMWFCEAKWYNRLRKCWRFQRIIISVWHKCILSILFHFNFMILSFYLICMLASSIREWTWVKSNWTALPSDRVIIFHFNVIISIAGIMIQSP